MLSVGSEEFCYHRSYKYSVLASHCITLFWAKCDKLLFMKSNTNKTLVTKCNKLIFTVHINLYIMANLWDITALRKANGLFNNRRWLTHLKEAKGQDGVWRPMSTRIPGYL